MNKPVRREGFVNEDEAAPDTDAEITAAATELPPEQPLVEADVWPIKVKLLYKPIRDNKGNEVRELNFREPSGGDINRYGNPCRIDQAGEVVIDEKKMTLIMAALTGILSPLLERMDTRDWNSCAYRLRNFFLPDLRAW